MHEDKCWYVAIERAIFKFKVEGIPNIELGMDSFRLRKQIHIMTHFLMAAVQGIVLVFLESRSSEPLNGMIDHLVTIIDTNDSGSLIYNFRKS